MPICMNSVFRKVLERLLYSRLYFFVVKHKLIQPAQNVFAHNKNNTLAIHNLKQVLQNPRQNLLHSVIFFEIFKERSIRFGILLF